MKNLFELITSYELSPNQLYALYCIEHKIECKHLNPYLELRILKQLNFLNEEYQLTDKAHELLGKSGALIRKVPDKTPQVKITEQQIDLYLELWPSMRLPHGKYARSDKKNIERNLKWFMSTYPYSFELILSATEVYVQEYTQRNYKFMRTSEYFIRKTDHDKSVKSELANYCSIVQNGHHVPNTSKTFPDKVV